MHNPPHVLVFAALATAGAPGAGCRLSPWVLCDGPEIEQLAFRGPGGGGGTHAGTMTEKLVVRFVPVGAANWFICPKYWFIYLADRILMCDRARLAAANSIANVATVVALAFAPAESERERDDTQG